MFILLILIGLTLTQVILIGLTLTQFILIVRRLAKLVSVLTRFILIGPRLYSFTPILAFVIKVFVNIHCIHSVAVVANVILLRLSFRIAAASPTRVTYRWGFTISNIRSPSTAQSCIARYGYS